MKKLRDNTFFHGLNGEQSDYVAGMMNQKNYIAGSIIIPENTTGDSAYLLIKGSIRIEKDLIPLIEGYESNPEDRKVLTLNDADNVFFGEVSLLDPGIKRTATVKAVSNVEVAEISKETFDKILCERQDVGVVILKNIGIKLSGMLDMSNKELSKMITAFTISLKL